jgi:hypothetical protein
MGEFDHDLLDTAPVPSRKLELKAAVVKKTGLVKKKPAAAKTSAATKPHRAEMCLCLTTAPVLHPCIAHSAHFASFCLP